MHCRHHPTCPGCPLLDQPPQAQLETKTRRLIEALSRYPHLQLPRVSPLVPAPRTEGYRHRLKLPVHVGKRVRIGLYARQTGRVLDTPDCPVLVPALRQTLSSITPWLARHPEVHSVDLRVSDATGEQQLILAADGGRLSGGAPAARDLLDTVEALASVAVSTADPARRRVMGRRPKVVAGARFITEAIGDTRYRLLPGAFFQVDPASASVLHGKVRGMLGDARTVLDLYAGVGAYALAMAEGRDKVLAVEEVPQAAEAARAMAPPQVEVVTSRVEDLDLREPVEVAILNPARRGSDPATLGRISHLAQRLIYVSCGPETLARDLDVLAAHGMHAREIVPLDLFPHTHEVETVVHLTRGKPRKTWATQGGRAGGPWLGKVSGAVGRADVVVAMVVGDPGRRGRLPGAFFERRAMVATHALLRIELHGPVDRALGALAKKGHPTVGRDPKTARFFADKAGLLRPFVHVLRAGDTWAPLHGDLAQALVHLGAPHGLVRRLTAPRARR